MGIKTERVGLQAYNRLVDMSASWLKYANKQSADLASSTNAAILHGIEVQTRRNVEEITQLRDAQGIILAARRVESDDTYAVKSDIGAVISAANAVITACQVAVPKDKDGYLLADKVDTAGGRIPRGLSANDVLGAKTALDALAVTLTN